MEGKLTEDMKNQFESWIHGGLKKFRLLYQITRDGCDPRTFHEKCDRQGPTVTVLYSPGGNMYGGYTAACWNGHRRRLDEQTFLFLYEGDGNRRKKFPVTSGYEVYCYPGAGPIFGETLNLVTFRGTIPNTGGQFELDGHFNLSHFYGARGMTPDDLNGGSMVVTELEVYGVAGETYIWVVQHGPL